jgi:hypothetical protein
MTYEELKSLFAESANSIAKASAEIASFAEERKKIERLFEKTDKQMEKTDLKIAKLAEQIGGIDNNIGHHAEQFFQNVFMDNKVFGGIEYNDIILNMKHGDKSGEVEFDIVLENGNSVALIEIKNRIHPDFVKKLAEERISKFRRYFPEYKEYDVYLGIAGFSFSQSVLEEAQKYGVGIIRQVGEGIEVDATSLKVYRYNQPRI